MAAFTCSLPTLKHISTLRKYGEKLENRPQS